MSTYYELLLEPARHIDTPKVSGVRLVLYERDKSEPNWNNVKDIRECKDLALLRRQLKRQVEAEGLQFLGPFGKAWSNAVKAFRINQAA